MSEVERKESVCEFGLCFTLSVLDSCIVVTHF